MLGRFLQNAKAVLPGRTITFEVMVFYDKRWVIDCIVDDEEMAIAHARNLLGDDKHEQVKVMRQRAMQNGFTTEKPVFEQVRAPKKKEIGLSASISAAPACETLEDLFGLDARVLMNRVFREFLDKLVITPSELLHSWSYIKKLDANGSLITGAVYQVAQAQAKAGQGNAKDRANALHKLVDQAKILARDIMAERKRMIVLEAGQFAQLCRRAEARFEPHERGYAVMTALTNYLAGSSSYGQKLEQLAKLMSDDVDADGLARLEGVIADALGAGSMVQEILGPQPNLGSALGLLAELSTGRIGELPRQASESLKLLVSLIQAKPMTASRCVLLDRLKRELASTKPLCKDDLNAERDMLDQLEKKLRDESGQLAGGAEVEKAIAARAEQIRKAHLRKAGIAT